MRWGQSSSVWGTDTQVAVAVVTVGHAFAASLPARLFCFTEVTGAGVRVPKLERGGGGPGRGPVPAGYEDKQ